METLIANVADNVGIDISVAEKAVGIMLALVKSDGDQSLVPDLMKALPGGDALADAHSGGGGLMGALGGALGGGSIAAFGKLTQAGLNIDQIKAVAKTVFEYATEQAGEPLVKQVVSSIPGLGSHI